MQGLCIKLMPISACCASSASLALTSACPASMLSPVIPHSSSLHCFVALGIVLAHRISVTASGRAPHPRSPVSPRTDMMTGGRHRSKERGRPKELVSCTAPASAVHVALTGHSTRSGILIMLCINLECTSHACSPVKVSSFKHMHHRPSSSLIVQAYRPLRPRVH